MRGYASVTHIPGGFISFFFLYCFCKDEASRRVEWVTRDDKAFKWTPCLYASCNCSLFLSFSLFSGSSVEGQKSLNAARNRMWQR